MLQKKILILINIIFGTFLLYTYYRGISNNPGIGLKLWGGVPQIITPYIIYSMFISAAGYFFFTYYLLFNIDNNSIKILNTFNYSIFIIIYLFILIPSCFWIDLTITYLNNPSSLLWIIICSILYTVGIFSIFLLIIFYSIKPDNPSYLYYISLIGCIFFAFHTMILDGLLWTILFHKTG